MFEASLRPRAAGALLAVLAVLTTAAPASAQVTTDVTGWSLSETTSTYNGGATQFHISSGGDGGVDYRWLDADMTKTTVISGNACTDYALFGKSTFGGGDTSYHRLFSGYSTLCFVLRGRTTGGTTIAHDGRVRR